MSRWRKDLGDWGEDLADEHLRRLGYRILGRKVDTGQGELDIVAQDGDTVVFVEVKAFVRVAPGSHPADNVHRAKQRRLARAARAFLAGAREEPACRFDVVTVVREPTVELEHIPGAFILGN